MAALPFSLIMLVMSAGLLQGLKDERYASRPGEYTIIPSEPWQIPDRLPETYDVEDNSPVIETDVTEDENVAGHRVGSGIENPSDSS